MSRFARWKTKYQRATGYVALATFLIVLYQLVRDLYASPYTIWKPTFPVFAVAAFGLAIAAIIIIAELDWRFVFAHEQAQTNVKNPLMYPMIYWSVWMLTHSPTIQRKDHPEIEQRLRETFRAMDAEDLFNQLLEGMQ